MAYVSQEMKKSLAPAIKAICKKYGVKSTLAVRNHMTLALNIKSGKIDFFSDYGLEGCNHKSGIQVNTYHYKNQFVSDALKFLSEVIPAMYGPNYYDNSDPQTDYFDCSHYIDVNIGKWDTPYIVIS